MPDTQLPRPIEPGEAQSGDTIERRFTVDGCAITQRMTVARVEGNTAYSPGDYPMLLSDGELILIDRPAPTPAPAVGERFSTSDGARWIAFMGSRGPALLAFCYSSGTHFRAGDEGAPSVAYLSTAYGPLIPIPDHGDGCSPKLWDPETGTAWVAGLNVTGVTHVQVSGELAFYGHLSAQYDTDRAIASRLRPYSERGQANG